MQRAAACSASPSPSSIRLSWRSAFAAAMLGTPATAYGSTCVQTAAEPLDRVGAAGHGLPPMRVQESDRADQRRLQRRAQLLAVAQDADGDRERVSRVALPRTLLRSFAMDAPGRHVQDLVSGGGQHRADESAVAGRVL